MNKQFVFILVPVFATAMANAAEPFSPLVNPAPAAFHLKECSTDIDCEFTGARVVSGQYVLDFDESYCESEQDGCLRLRFMPDDPSQLPHFESRPLKSIGISNFRAAALKLLGKPMTEKAITSGKATSLAMKSNQAKLVFATVKGSATVKLNDLKIGISCDSPYAYAELVAIQTKTTPKFEERVVEAPNPDL